MGWEFRLLITPLLSSDFFIFVNARVSNGTGWDETSWDKDKVPSRGKILSFSLCPETAKGQIISE